MKNLLFTVLVLLFVCNWETANAQRGGTIDTTFEILKRIDYSAYVRQPVDSLLHHIPANYQSMNIVGHHKPDYGDELHIFYPNDVTLIIRVKNFQYMNPKPDFVNNPNASWDLTLFKKENIFFSALYRGPICYNGCDKEEAFAH